MKSALSITISAHNKTLENKRDFDAIVSSMTWPVYHWKRITGANQAGFQPDDLDRAVAEQLPDPV
jgi:hypothetical protein